MTHHAALRYSEQDAAEVAYNLYGITASARSLPSEYDDNFQMTTTTGERFVLKIMHPDREPSLVDLQVKVLEHLASNAPSLTLPRVQYNLQGTAVTPLQASDGSMRLVWMLSYIPGQVLAKAKPHSPDLLRSLGAFLGQLDAALVNFTHASAERELKWDLTRAGWIRDYLGYIDDPQRRALVESHLKHFEAEVAPQLIQLRRSVIHGDANDYNVLVKQARVSPGQVESVIDFGDMLLTCTVSELAIAVAYALMNKPDPLTAAAHVIAGYHAAFPLTEQEIALMYPLICIRLCVSVTNSAYRKSLEPDDPYLTISERPAWDSLEQLAHIHPRFARYVFRHACGLTPVPQHQSVVDWLSARTQVVASVLDTDVRREPGLVFDLSVGSLMLGADPGRMACSTMSELLFGEMKQAGVRVGVGRYDEARLIYQSEAFTAGGHPTDEHRTIHLGLDLFAEAGSLIYAPLDGVVHTLANNAAPYDYGPLIILQHETDEQQVFYTLYGHLSEDSLNGLTVGQAVRQGQKIAAVGAPPTNGDWPPHLHLQIILDLLGVDRDFPGVAYASQRAVWTSLSPDANLIVGVPADRFHREELSKDETLAGRRERIGRSLSISYRNPLKIVRGWMQYLYDETGRAYLDVYNNVPLVGHSHPRLVKAAQQQLALLNTNTRYLHDNIVRYAERLTGLMPDPLKVCFFLNSASEANELALRLARTYTNQQDMIVLDAAYHGHTGGLIDISPYKFNGPGGTGRKPWVHIAPIPDDYRGVYKRSDPEAGRKYAQHVAEIIQQLQAEGRSLAAYIAETLPSVGGQVVFPPGYLGAVYRYVRGAGGVCIADEVQVGFGRLGTHVWGFETQGVVPDIVVLGKPIGNGFPLAAVVTSEEIAASFDNGMEFFSTFGGNPVACAVGLAVLDVLEQEGLQANALKVGNYLLNGLRGLMERHALIGDVRGSGLFLGVELVKHRETLEPAPDEASYVVNRLREGGILAGTDGPYHNVLKLRPPLIFTEKDADFLLGRLDRILEEDAAQV